MNNNKQQTAIEWLMNQALSGTKNTKTGCLHIEFPNKALQQAKEIEKERIIQFALYYTYGQYNVPEETRINIEKLYNKVYKEMSNEHQG